MMELEPNTLASRLSIYVGESDRWRGKQLYAALLDILKEQGMAGATVLRGVAGFGAHSRIHTSAIEILSQDLPLVVTVIDSREKIIKVLDVISPMVREGLVILEDVQVIKYTHRFLNPLPADRPISDVMTKEVATLTPDMAVHEAWQKMLDSQVKAMPVVDDKNRVVGILTDQDLLDRAGIQQRLSIALRMDPDMVVQELRGLQTSFLKVSDVMTSPVVTSQEDEPLGVVTARMVKAGLKRMPIVNKKGYLVGVISRLDILNQLTNVPTPSLPKNYPAGTLQVLKDIMTDVVPRVSLDDGLPVIIQQFLRTKSHRLIVVDNEGKVIGLISDSDVVGRIQSTSQKSILDAFKIKTRIPAGKETAADLMSRKALIAPPDMLLVEAARKMIGEGRKWLVVVDEKNRPLGLVDRQILLEAIAPVVDVPMGKVE